VIRGEVGPLLAYADESEKKPEEKEKSEEKSQ